MFTWTAGNAGQDSTREGMHADAVRPALAWPAPDTVVPAAGVPLASPTHAPPLLRDCPTWLQHGVVEALSALCRAGARRTGMRAVRWGCGRFGRSMRRAPGAQAYQGQVRNTARTAHLMRWSPLLLVTHAAGRRLGRHGAEASFMQARYPTTRPFSQGPPAKARQPAARPRTRQRHAQPVIDFLELLARGVADALPRLRGGAGRSGGVPQGGRCLQLDRLRCMCFASQQSLAGRQHKHPRTAGGQEGSQCNRRGKHGCDWVRSGRPAVPWYCLTWWYSGLPPCSCVTASRARVLKSSSSSNRALAAR